MNLMLGLLGVIGLFRVVFAAFCRFYLVERRVNVSSDTFTFLVILFG